MPKYGIPQRRIIARSSLDQYVQNAFYFVTVVTVLDIALVT